MIIFVIILVYKISENCDKCRSQSSRPQCDDLTNVTNNLKPKDSICNKIKESKAAETEWTKQ